MLLKYIYTVFLGLLIVVFIGIGIGVFYEQPADPNCFSQINYSSKEQTESQAQQEKQCQEVQRQWEKNTLGPYNRNVSIIALLFAVLLVGIGILLEPKNKVIANGVMLGGVFTLVYSMGRGFASYNTKYSFAIVSIGLLVAILLGLRHFKEPKSKVAKV